MPKVIGRNNDETNQIDTALLVSDCVHALNRRQQAVIALRFAGYTQEATAEILGVSRFTVWKDEAAGLRELRNKISVSVIEDNTGE